MACVFGEHKYIYHTKEPTTVTTTATQMLYMHINLVFTFRENFLSFFKDLFYYNQVKYGQGRRERNISYSPHRKWKQKLKMEASIS
jgi:hypothetical protein